MSYTIYNKRLERRLIHPRVGVWYTNDLEEAISMLAACQDYVRTMDMDPTAFVLWDVEEDKEFLIPTKISL
jgi:hypothetical protein